MNMKDNLISSISSNDEIKQLQQQLSSALEQIKNYEELIAELKVTNSNNLKQFTHDLSNPLQVLSMTVEFMEDKVPAEYKGHFERIRKSSETMVDMIAAIRKLRTSSVSSANSIKVV